MAYLYEIYSGEELKIAELIQRRRYQMLVHSYIYYELNKNIISDSQWSKWAMELVDLQSTYPEIAKKVPYDKDFIGWDGSSGAFFDYVDKPNIVTTAQHLLAMEHRKSKPVKVVPQQRKPLITPAPAKKKLF
jgi:hypothetical protein